MKFLLSAVLALSLLVAPAGYAQKPKTGDMVKQAHIGKEVTATPGVDYIKPGVAYGTNGSIFKRIRIGRATLVAGTATIADTNTTATSNIMLAIQSLGTVTVAKPIAVTARSNGVSFTITSSDATDTSVIAYTIYEP